MNIYIYMCVCVCVCVQLCAINKLYPKPKLKHLLCNLSSWKILTEWTRSLYHINVQFKTKIFLSSAVCFKDICGSEDTTPHTYSQHGQTCRCGSASRGGRFNLWKE